MRMKYVVLEIDGEKMPIIFPDSLKLSHKTVLRGIQLGIRMAMRNDGDGFKEVVPVSMGFVYGVNATRVDGFSESARYGFDAIDREHWGVTEAHPETDLPLINGGKSAEQAAYVAMNSPQVQHRGVLGRMIRGQTDDTRHLNSKARRKLVEEFISIHLSAECNEAGGYGAYITKARDFL